MQIYLKISEYEIQDAVIDFQNRDHDRIFTFSKRIGSEVLFTKTLSGTTINIEHERQFDALNSASKIPAN